MTIPLPSARPTLGRSRRFATLRTITALILREMSTRYGRTPGGFFWSILEPLAAILFLSIGFSLVIRAPALGSSFLLFYASGYMPLDIYQTISLTTSRALDFSRPLLRYPAVSWIDTILARFILNSLSAILVTALLLTGILIAIDNRTAIDMIPIIKAMSLAMVLGLGVGTLNCCLMGLFPLWAIIWSVLTRPLFLASGIFFLYDDLTPLAQKVLWYNPLIHIIGLMRTGFYPSYTAAYVNIPFALLTSMILLTLGLILMGRFHRVILNR